MLILTIRTDKPEAELGLYESEKKLAYFSWPAHKKLAETIHLKIKDLLEQNGFELQDLKGIAVYAGPGSFTGLRIGISVANALAGGLSIPITSSGGNDWLESAIAELQQGKNAKIVKPNYGSPPHITRQKR